MNPEEIRKPNKQVSIEDLLRVKRNEKPDDLFWQRFERDFQRRQISAVIEPSRWWWRISIPLRHAANSRASQITIGATLAVAAFSVYQVTQASNSAVIRQSVAIHDPAYGDTPAGKSNLQQLSLVESHSDKNRKDIESEPAAESAVDINLAEVKSELSPPIASNDVTDKPSASQAVAAGKKPDTPAARTADFSALTSTDELVASFGQRDFGKHTQDDLAKIQNDELEAVSGRISRLLDTSDLVPKDDHHISGKEKIASRLDEETLYASASRLGIGGDRVFIRF